MTPKVNPDALAPIRDAGTSMEQIARNWDANLPALREATGMRSMQELSESVQAGMRTINETLTPQRLLTAAADEYNRRMAEINGEASNGAQDQ